MRIAAIDIGTNSTRLLIAEVENGVLTEEIYRRSEITRLGQDVYAVSALKPEAISRTLAVVRTYADLAAEYCADTIKAVATSATRVAENAADFLLPAKQILGAAPKIISGETEASLAYNGALSGEAVRAMGDKFLVIDIGGGSTEIIRGDKEVVKALTSLPLGCVRLTEIFFASDPPHSGDLTALYFNVNRILTDSCRREIAQGVVPLAVAGTPTSLAAIELGLGEYDRDRVHCFKLKRSSVAAVLDRLMSVSLMERKDIVGLESRRADVIIAGTAVLLEIMTYFDFDHVYVSEHDILDGLVLN